ncbi:hypothetical protein PHYC_02368 [Phycisphaerales bacterium]|nr:hypothetical protein PHYC_02368 [Phycisphaerales bacterium]
MSNPSGGLVPMLRQAAGHFYTTATSRGRGRLFVQVIGALVGLGLLAWVIVKVVNNRETLDRLLHAPPHLLLALFGLSICSLLLNGLAFWITLRPVKRIRIVDMLATNAVASALSIPPLKLSVVWRLLIHSRRDQIPVLTIGAYLAANAVVVLAVVLPMGAAGLWRRQVDLAYALTSLAGVLAALGVVYTGARAFAGEHGLARIQRIAGVLRLRPLNRLLASRAFARLHHALAILSHAPTLFGAATVRAMDMLAQSSRFVIAATAVGVTISFEKAVLVGSVFYIIGVASPAGALGSREGGSTLFADALNIAGTSRETYAVIVLAVSVTEMFVWTAGAGLSLLYLRPGRYFRAAQAQPAAPPNT